MVLEVSRKVGRHFWRQLGAELNEQDWDRLPAVLGTQPDLVAEARELTRAVRRAVEDATDHQRRIFGRGAPGRGNLLDALGSPHDTTRNALYKVFVRRRGRKIRVYLVASKYLEADRRKGVPTHE